MRYSVCFRTCLHLCTKLTVVLQEAITNHMHERSRFVRLKQPHGTGLHLRCEGRNHPPQIRALVLRRLKPQTRALFHRHCNIKDSYIMTMRDRPVTLRCVRRTSQCDDRTANQGVLHFLWCQSCCSPSFLPPSTCRPSEPCPHCQSHSSSHH